MRSWKNLLSAVFILMIVAAIWLERSRKPQPRPRVHRAPVPVGAFMNIQAPLGLPPVAFPADNPPTAETIALGRKLYYDPILSADNTVSCASCHDPENGFADEKPVSEGVRGQKGTRNSPTVCNAAYFTVQFWDGRAPTLEKQAEGPVQNPVEMAHTLEGAAKKLSADPVYRAEFEKAFGPGPIRYEVVAKAIASFERTVISGNSPFDRFFYGGDKKALSAAARRGLEVFRSPAKGNCAVCHTIGDSHALFTDNKFHNIGVGAGGDRFADLGRYNVTKNDADRGAFKTPTLRNVVLSGPYMHDGSLKTLKDVVDFYVGGGNSNPYLDRQIKALELTAQERADLVAFMQALTGEIPPDVMPPKVRRAERE